MALINFEQHLRDLTPPDWVSAMDACSEGELRWVEEQAAKWAALRHPGAAGVGRVLHAQVRQIRALRVARQGRADAEFWTMVEDTREPVEEPDVSGIPPWSQVSAPPEEPIG